MDKDLITIDWTNSAVANRADLSSTGAFVIGLIHKSILDGVCTRVNLISWRSGKLPRTARSSLSAEASAEAMFCRALFAELFGHDMNLRASEDTTKKVAGAMLIDAQSVFDTFHKGNGASSAFSMKEKYSAPELLRLQWNMMKQNADLLWVSSDAQLADGLTKASAQDIEGGPDVEFLRRRRRCRSQQQVSGLK